MRLLRVGLGMRIFSGFGILLCLLLGIALSASYGLFIVGGEVGKMDAIAGSLRRVQEITYRTEVIRRGLTRYRLDADENALRDVTNAETRSIELLDQLAGSPPRRKRARFTTASLPNCVALRLSGSGSSPCFMPRSRSARRCRRSVTP